MNLIGSLKRIGELLPVELVLKECLKHGVAAIELKNHLFSIPGSYGEGVIALDPDADKERIVRTIRRRHGLEIRSDEVFVWIFYHELGHHVLGSDQAKAERFAFDKFMEWRIKNPR
jgi:hypothetical protein